jgi:DNA-binding protein H-NS
MLQMGMPHKFNVGYIRATSFHGDKGMAKQSLKLNQMALAELVQLRDEVQSALNNKIGIERRELQAKLAEITKLQNGSKAKSAAKGRVVRKDRRHLARGKRVAPKYRGPNGETWAGRGLAPRWLAELEAKGKKRDAFLIER